jgi:hypothetical protein
MASTDACPCYVACWPILILSSLYIIRRVLEGVSTLDGLRATGTESQGNRVDAGDDSHAQAGSTCKNTLKGGTASITLTVLQLSINFGRCFTALRTALTDAYFLQNATVRQSGTRSSCAQGWWTLSMRARQDALRARLRRPRTTHRRRGPRREPLPPPACATLRAHQP